MERTWKPTIAGMLCIIAGDIGVFCVPLLTLILSVIAGIAVWPKESSANPIIGLGILGMVFAIIAIVGGVHAYRRRHWGLALAGSICALFGPAGFLGIPATIFVITGKREFK